MEQSALLCKVVDAANMDDELKMRGLHMGERRQPSMRKGRESGLRKHEGMLTIG